MRVMGIDEAGRGCVFGPLVVASFAVDGVDPQALAEAGAGDSKGMTARRRAEVRERLAALGTAEVRVVSARQIDDGNLNALEEAAIVELVRRWRPDRVVIDALGPPSGTARVIARLQAAVGRGRRITWVMEPRADANHPVVGAASVFAKTTRDGHLDALRAEWGDLGSGYPSDPKVQAWLQAWHATGKPWPPFVRTRWATVAALAQQRLW